METEDKEDKTGEGSEPVVKRDMSFEKTKWNYYHEKLIGWLRTIYLEQKQIESITARIRTFAESLIETDKEEFLEGLYTSLFTIDGKDELIEAFQKIQKGESNKLIANYKAAGHKVMRNLWECLDRCNKQVIDAGDKLIYLSEKYVSMYQQLTEKIIGQDYAVNEFVQSCFDAELYQDNPDHPQAVYLFAGPPGVGKTFLAQNVADALGRPFKAFDMASYSMEKSDLSLIGVEPGFKNALEGTLVGFVEDNPDAIILFDEIEKAHSDVTRLFLSVIDGARLENKFLESNTDFSKTILIFTTNAGKSIYEDNKKNLSATPTDVIIKELRKEKSSDNGQPKFPPELCSRFASQHIVMFNHIGVSDMVKLIVNRMDETCKGIEEKLHVGIDYDKRLALLLLMHFGNVDVRVVTGKAQQFIRREIYELSRHLTGIKGIERIKHISLSIDDTRISDKARSFFSTNDSEEVLLGVVCDEATRKKLECIHIDPVSLLFIDSEEKLLECDPDNVTAFIIDPYYEMFKVNDKILGLDDYDSVGLRIIKTLLKKEITAPIFVLENGKKVSRTDKNTLYMRGVEDTICFDDHDPQEVIKNIVAEHLLQEKCSSMLNRRKIFDFESLQEMPDPDGVVKIKFYDIIVKDAVNAEDQDLLINIEERPDIKFNDVIGADNAKAELKDFIKYIENPKAYMKYALAVPKGVLLYGPPGTGKTMLAKALAGETDATFISISAAKLRSSGEGSVERLFTTARKYAPSIIFIDEVDAIAHTRTGSSITSYEDSLLNMLLTQMDGFEQHKDTPVFVVAATNFGVEDDPMSGTLDPAFLRRFGNKIYVDLPNKTERIQFLSKNLKGKGSAVLNNIVTEAGIKNIAERTPDESLATLENILELAFRNAARKRRQLDDELLDEAREEYFFGEKKDKDEKQAFRTAVHEASHAYIYSLSGKKPAYLTVVSRGNYGGYMQHEDDENKAPMSKDEFRWAIRTSLAGRVGELVVFGDEAALNIGASADLKHASYNAMNMLALYGMQEGHLFSLSYDEVLRSNLLPLYVEETEKILEQEKKICFDLIEKGKDTILALANALLEKNHLNQEEIAVLLGIE
ncbi:MAG: AAA family ATPase [Lachnospiraceae bacterium]|nr:AAA family ATPase [Lachnospiraceae bacterium]